MGMTIDTSLLYESGYNKGFKDGIKGSIPKAEVKKFLEEGTKDVGNNVLAIVREDYIHKADYETRLKADMVAMLTELQLEIDEKVHSYHSRYCPACEAIDRKSVSNLIQQKINELKAEIEPQESEEA